MTASVAGAVREATRSRSRLRPAKTRAEVERARALIGRIGDLSDNIVRIGPFGLGLDGVLAWIPFVGSAYSVGAGAVLLTQGWRAHVSPARLAAAAAIMGARTVVGGVPILGDIIVDLVRGHRYSARLLQNGITRTLYVEVPAARAQADPVLREQIAAAKRVVFLRPHSPT